MAEVPTARTVGAGVDAQLRNALARQQGHIRPTRPDTAPRHASRPCPGIVLRGPGTADPAQDRVRAADDCEGTVRHARRAIDPARHSTWHRYEVAPEGVGPQPQRVGLVQAQTYAAVRAEPTLDLKRCCKEWVHDMFALNLRQRKHVPTTY